jgi:hypothetical protein
MTHPLVARARTLLRRDIDRVYADADHPYHQAGHLRHRQAVADMSRAYGHLFPEPEPAKPPRDLGLSVADARRELIALESDLKGPYYGGNDNTSHRHARDRALAIREHLIARGDTGSVRRADGSFIDPSAPVNADRPPNHADANTSSSTDDNGR